MKTIKIAVAILLLGFFLAIFYIQSKPNELPLFVFFNHKQNVETELPVRLQEIHTLMPIWAYVQNSSGALADHDLEKQKRIEAIIKKSPFPINIIPVINNHNGIDWQKNVIEEILEDVNKQENLILNLIDYLKRNHYRMINLDFEAFSEKHLDDYVEFLQRAALKLHQENLEISVCISPYWAPLLKNDLGSALDQIVLMIYDEHWVTSPPGPISSQAWFEKTFKQLYEMFPKHKIIAGIGNYAYDWPRNKPAIDMTVNEAMELAKKVQAVIITDDASKNPMFHYIDKSGVPHQVWMLNVETFRMQMHFLKDFPIGGAALWQLGSEDPQIWSTWIKQ